MSSGTEPSGDTAPAESKGAEAAAVAAGADAPVAPAAGAPDAPPAAGGAGGAEAAGSAAGDGPGAAEGAAGGAAAQLVEATVGAPDAEYRAFCEELGVRLYYDVGVCELPHPIFRGVVAQEAVPAGKPILSVPASALLTVDYAPSSPLAPAFALSEELQMREDDVLALLLLSERRRGAESRWSQHIARLPPRVDNAFYFNIASPDGGDGGGGEQEARAAAEREALRGANLLELAQRMQEQLRADYERIFPALFERFGELGLRADGGYSLEDYRWAVATIWSRFVSVKIGGRERKAMVPFMDMCNHSPTQRSSHRFDDKTGALTLVSQSKWSPGQEVTIFYGPLSNAALLQKYGMALPRNPFEEVQVWASMAPGAEDYERKLRCLAEHGIDLRRPFSLREGEACEPFLSTGRVMRIDAGAEEQWARVEGAFDGRIITPDNERAMLRSTIDSLRDMIDRYGPAVDAAAEARAAALARANDMAVAAVDTLAARRSSGKAKKGKKGKKGKKKGGKGGGAAAQAPGRAAGEGKVMVMAAPSAHESRLRAYAVLRASERGVLLSQLRVLTQRFVELERHAARRRVDADGGDSD